MRGFTDKPKACLDCGTPIPAPSHVVRKRCPDCSANRARMQRNEWKRKNRVRSKANNRERPEGHPLSGPIPETDSTPLVSTPGEEKTPF